MWNLFGVVLLASVAMQLPMNRQSIIERIMERNRGKDISELVAQGRVKVNLTGYEYNTTGGMISVNKEKNKTQIKINVDEGSGPVKAESFANVGGELSAGVYWLSFSEPLFCEKLLGLSNHKSR